MSASWASIGRDRGVEDVVAGVAATGPSELGERRRQVLVHPRAVAPRRVGPHRAFEIEQRGARLGVEGDAAVSGVRLGRFGHAQPVPVRIGQRHLSRPRLVVDRDAEFGAQRRRRRRPRRTRAHADSRRRRVRTDGSGRCHAGCRHRQAGAARIGARRPGRNRVWRTRSTARAASATRRIGTTSVVTTSAFADELVGPLLGWPVVDQDVDAVVGVDRRRRIRSVAGTEWRASPPGLLNTG